MTDIDRLREQIELVQRVATIVATTQPQWSAALTALLNRLAAAERERDELIHDIERHIAIASREAEARIQAERELDAAIRALQTHKGEQ